MADGFAKRDQGPYLGNYKKIADYNGHAAYEQEGKSQLYIYFYSSPPDNLEMWVIGPELGEFIAGIRNEARSACVHEAHQESRWLYAARSARWKADDATLNVACLGPGEQVTQRAEPIFGTRTPTPRTKTTTTTTRRPRPTTEASLDCRWSAFGSWGQCSRSCGGGVQTRFRSILRQARGRGRRCLGAREESRTCNVESCRTTTTSTTTRRPPTTTIPRRRLTLTASTTTTSRPSNARPANASRSEGVRCYACNSLFSVDAPHCPSFNARDTAQQTVCGKGEACLWYSYHKSDTETEVIRECLSTSVLLGSIDDPILPSEQCVPKAGEGDSFMACLCTEDFCNGLDGGSSVSKINSNNNNNNRRTTTRPRITTPTQRPLTNISPSRDPKKGVLCHQCGSLFSSDGNANCDEFDPSSPSQQDYCKPGESCLYYSWEKSATEVSAIRECFAPSVVLLGPVTNPLTPSRTCSPRDISESPGSSIMACLCDTDLCNALESKTSTNKRRRPQQPPREQPRRPAEPSRRPTVNNFDEDGDVLSVLNSLQQVNQQESRNRPRTTTSRPRTTEAPPRRRVEASVATPNSDGGGLQCFSCGSLLNLENKCDEFDPSDPNQVQTCEAGEACLLYSWKKSSTETGKFVKKDYVRRFLWEK